MFDIKLAAHLAELSKIEFTDDELQKISAEMDEIIVLMDTVSDFESNETSVVNPAQNLKDIREDIPAPSLPREEILKNSAKTDDKAFTVPKVV